MADKDPVQDGMYHQVVLKADTLTEAGRVYPKEVLEKAVAEYQAHLASGIVLGPPDEDGVVRLRDVAFKVEDVSMVGDEMTATVCLLGTKSGEELTEKLRTKKVRLHPVGFGSVKDGKVQDDFLLTSFSVWPKDEEG